MKIDLHRAGAAKFLGKPEEQVTKDQRNLFKNIFFFNMYSWLYHIEPKDRDLWIMVIRMISQQVAQGKSLEETRKYIDEITRDM